MFSLSLSAKSLENIPVDSMPRDFEFVIDGKSYMWNSVLADFLSPKIAKIHSSDPSFSRFELSSHDKFGVFKSILSLSIGGVFEVSEECADTVRAIASELGNREMIADFLSRENQLNVKTVFEIVKLKQCFGLDYSPECAFIASHFADLEVSDLSRLEYSILLSVISNDALKLENEDQLCSFLLSLCADNPSYFTLFQEVRFEYLSVEGITGFCERVALAGHDLGSGIWSRLAKRLCMEVDSSRDYSRHREILDLSFKKGELDGIIGYLTAECGGNVHDEGVVEISGGPAISNESRHALKNVADLDSDSSFFSNGKTYNHTICYDFKLQSIIPTAYAIRSRYDGGVNNQNLKSWVIEISRDGTTWTEIDKRENDSELNDSNVTKVFTVNNKEKCRYIRLRQTGASHHPTWKKQIIVSGFEIFGMLIR